jgi:hypothetical protein
MGGNTISLPTRIFIDKRRNQIKSDASETIRILVRKVKFHLHQFYHFQSI